MTRIFRFSITILLALLITDITALAQRKKANARSSARTSVSNKHTDVSRNRNVNRNTNIDLDRDINIDRDVDVDVDWDHGCCFHGGWGTAAAVATTAAVTAAAVGSIVNTLPPSCAPVVVNGYTYQQCGNTWYQPQISGSSTTYVVVNPPR